MKFIEIQSDNGVCIVPLDKILYIKKLDNRSIIYLLNDIEIIAFESISTIKNKIKNSYNRRKPLEITIRKHKETYGVDPRNEW